jgi:alkyl hydroperoxide reductase subunit AhpC
MTRKVVKDYGILNEDMQIARRATFVVDGDGIIQHVEQGNSAIDPTGAHTVCARISPKKS